MPAVLALLAGVVLWSSRDPRETFGPSSSDIISAGAVPVTLFTVLGLLCIKQFLASFVKRPPPEDVAGAHPQFDWRRVGMVCLWFATCIALIGGSLSFDLTLSVVVFATGWAFVAGQRRPIGLAVVALTAAVITNVLVYFTTSPVASLL